MKLSRKEQEVLTDLIRQFRRRLGAKDVLLYGSAVREEMDEASDIDLLVVLPEVNWSIEKQISHLCFEAQLECGRVVSTVCFSEKELKDTPLRSSPLVLNAQREGRYL